MMAVDFVKSGKEFPKIRFSLELVDSLLDTPCVFPLTQPVITIGLSGGNSWNLPLEHMGLESMKLWGNDEKKKKHKPLLTLKFHPKTGTWKATQAYGPCSSYTEPQNCDWKAAFSQLEPGLRVQASLPHDLGFFTLILHDAERPPSAFTQKLASLPEVPLGIIASYLHPVHCARYFCSFSQSVAQKLCTAGVEWPQVSLLDIKTKSDGIKCPPKIDNFLDCMRVAKLLRNGDVLKTLFLGTGDGRWEKKAVKELLSKQVEKFIFAPKLQRLGLAVCWLGCIGSARLSELLRTVYVEFDGCVGHDACKHFWYEMSRLKLASSTEVTVKCGEPGPPADLDDVLFATADWEMPNVVKLSVGYCGHLYFLPRKGLTNLKELKLSMDWWHDHDFNLPSGCYFLNERLERSSFPSLTKVDLNISEDYVQPFIDALAAAAPNLQDVESLSISTSDVPMGSAWAMERLRSSIDSFRKLLNLRQLQLTFEDWTPVGLESVLDFCLAMRSTVSVIGFDSVVCDDIWSPGVRRVSESLKQRGKSVDLTKSPHDVKLLCLPDDLFDVKERLLEFYVAVCDE